MKLKVVLCLHVAIVAAASSSCTIACWSQVPQATPRAKSSSRPDLHYSFETPLTKIGLPNADYVEAAVKMQDSVRRAIVSTHQFSKLHQNADLNEFIRTNQTAGTLFLQITLEPQGETTSELFAKYTGRFFILPATIHTTHALTYNLYRHSPGSDPELLAHVVYAPRRTFIMHLLIVPIFWLRLFSTSEYEMVAFTTQVFITQASPSID